VGENGTLLAMGVDRQAHWQRVHRDKSPEELTWFQAVPEVSLALIERAGCKPDEPVIDVGAGSSRLVDELLDRGFDHVIILDIAEAGLNAAQQRLGERAARVEWIEGDVLELALPTDLALWHDRAVFHFLVEAEERRLYLDQLRASLRPGGHVIIATFAEDGPERCSGLPVARYSPRQLDETLGADFELIESRAEVHLTPAGREQRFVYCLFRHSPAR
jgi:SAM-dependent methyltransferase